MTDERWATVEGRLAAAERAVAELRAVARPVAAAADPKDPLKDHPMFRQSITDPKELAEFEARIDKQLGIDGLEPMEPAKLRQMMIDEDGIDPDGNEFSRGIIEMRE